MNLDLVTYGNPNIDQLLEIGKETYCDVLFDELAGYTFPTNSSEATKEELNEIADYLKQISRSEEHLKRYRLYDINLAKTFSEYILSELEDKDKAIQTMQSIIQETKPLLLKLKYHHQRPRPYQLAEYYKLKLFPYPSKSADSPSFPSGHAFQSRLISEVLGNHYPKYYAHFNKYFTDICYSRVYMGLHYQSDIDVAIFCADKVFELPEFKTKYKL